MSSSEPTQELTSYNGNCHCGAVKYTVQTPSLSSNTVNSCNCSNCSRNGYLLIFLKRADIHVHTGYDHMVSYFFGDKKMAHKFCPTCGSSVMIDFSEKDKVAINVRMIENIVVKDLSLKDVDGKKFKPEYQCPKINSGIEPSEISASTLTPYDANCHCGDVTYTVYIPSITSQEVMCCNCSICTRNGYLLLYPARKEVIFHTGYDRLHTYEFGSKRVTHKFCPICGSSILIGLHGLSHLGPDKMAINIRMFQEDINLKELNYRYFDGQTILKPAYVVGN